MFPSRDPRVALFMFMLWFQVIARTAPGCVFIRTWFTCQYCCYIVCSVVQYLCVNNNLYVHHSLSWLIFHEEISHIPHNKTWYIVVGLFNTERLQYSVGLTMLLFRSPYPFFNFRSFILDTLPFIFREKKKKIYFYAEIGAISTRFYGIQYLST